MTDMIKIKLRVETGFCGANHEDIYEVEREWWDSLNEEQKEKELDDTAIEFMWNYINCSACVIEEEE